MSLHSLKGKAQEVFSVVSDTAVTLAAPLWGVAMVKLLPVIERVHEACKTPEEREFAREQEKASKERRARWKELDWRTDEEISIAVQDNILAHPCAGALREYASTHENAPGKIFSALNYAGMLLERLFRPDGGHDFCAGGDVRFTQDGSLVGPSGPTGNKEILWEVRRCAHLDQAEAEKLWKGIVALAGSGKAGSLFPGIWVEVSPQGFSASQDMNFSVVYDGHERFALAAALWGADRKEALGQPVMPRRLSPK